MRPKGPQYRTLACAVFVVFTLTAGPLSPQTPKLPTPRLKEEMRLPWVPDSGGYLRQWLLCGEFPNPPGSGAGLTTDFLKEHGGEARITPAEGMAHKRPDGTEARWTRLAADQDLVDFQKLLAPRPVTNAVAYAYTSVSREKEEKALLSVGSDDGVRVWLNGDLVLDHAVARAAVPDEDQVEVTLRRGGNTLLVKVDQGTGGWGFFLRFLDPRRRSVEALSPSLLNGDHTGGTLRVLSDRADPKRATDKVCVEPLAPGGAALGTYNVPRGSVVSMDTHAWRDGPYEVRLRATSPLGERQVVYLPWYKGDILAAARGLADTRPARGGGPIQDQRAMLADLVRDQLSGQTGATQALGASAFAAVHAALMEVAELDAEAGGARPGGCGFVRLAYRDETDGSTQFCRAYLPAGYDPTKRWPLVVNLHGYNGDNPPYIRWWSVTTRHNPLVERHQVIQIEPHGRGNTSYLGIGERDVLRCVELAKQRFSIDDDRVYLYGYSMGGGGTWHVGTRHPEIFAAIGPIYGGWDYHVELTEDQLAKLTPRERFLREAESSFALAECLLTTPIFVAHGDADEVVPTDFSRYAVRMLQRWGYELRYWEVPGKGHAALSNEDELMRWFLAHKRVSQPRKVRIHSGELKTASAHWLRVTQREDPYQFILAEAEVTSPNVLRLDTRNAVEVTLSPGATLVDPAKPLLVSWNGKPSEVMLQDGTATLRDPGYLPAPLVKHPGLEGPWGEGTNTPFALVVGTTSKDPLMRLLCKRKAEDFVRSWETWQKVRPRLYLDSEIPEADQQSYSLILFGGPEDNLVTRKLMDRLPLKLEGKQVVLDGRTFEAPDSAVQVLYPNPLNSRRYVLLNAATSPKGMFHLDRMPDRLDFRVSDGRVPPEPNDQGAASVCIASGLFDKSWRVSDALLDRGDSAARAQAPVRRTPIYVDTGVAAQTLYLDEVLEAVGDGTSTAVMRGLGGTGQPMILGGKTYAHGLGINPDQRGPVALEYNLEGATWKRLRGAIGVEADLARSDSGDGDATRRAGFQVRFVVWGDDKELFRSQPVKWDTPPADLNVDLTGVKVLRLEAVGESQLGYLPRSVDWADVRLEK